MNETGLSFQCLLNSDLQTSFFFVLWNYILRFRVVLGKVQPDSLALFRVLQAIKKSHSLRLDFFL